MLATQKAWKVPFIGNTHVLLHNTINNMNSTRGRSPYGNILTIVQSSTSELRERSNKPGMERWGLRGFEKSTYLTLRVGFGLLSTSCANDKSVHQTVKILTMHCMSVYRLMVTLKLELVSLSSFCYCKLKYRNADSECNH